MQRAERTDAEIVLTSSILEQSTGASIIIKTVLNGVAKSLTVAVPDNQHFQLLELVYRMMESSEANIVALPHDPSLQAFNRDAGPAGSHQATRTSIAMDVT